MSDADKMKPIVILPPELLTKEDIQALRDNGLCVVEAADPSKVKFLDPIPSVVGHTKVEEAAIAFTRRVLSRDYWARFTNGEGWRAEMALAYVGAIVKGTFLDPNAPDYKFIFDTEKADEIRKIAREEAREERKATKEAKAAATAKAKETKKT